MLLHVSGHPDLWRIRRPACTPQVGFCLFSGPIKDQVGPSGSGVSFMGSRISWSMVSRQGQAQAH